MVAELLCALLFTQTAAPASAGAVLNLAAPGSDAAAAIPAPVQTVPLAHGRVIQLLEAMLSPGLFLELPSTALVTVFAIADIPSDVDRLFLFLFRDLRVFDRSS